MRQHFSDGDLFFAGLREFRPAVADAEEWIEPTGLQGVEETRRGESLGDGPEEDRCVWSPGLSSRAIAPPAGAREKLRAVAPDADARAELAVFGEVLVEEIGESVGNVHLNV